MFVCVESDFMKRWDVEKTFLFIMARQATSDVLPLSRRQVCLTNLFVQRLCQYFCV